MMNHHRFGRHAAKDLALISIIDIAQGVVQKLVFCFGVGVRSTGDRNDRQVFGICTGNRIQQAQAADAECHNRSRRTSCRAGITIGGVTGVEFVATGDHLQVAIGQELIEQH